MSKRSFSSTWIFVFSLVLIFLSSAWLLLYHLGKPALYLGEAYTWWFVRQPWPDMFAAVRLDGVHPPLYYILEKLFVDMMGQTEIGLRLLSVLVSLVGLIFSALLGWQVGGGAGALAGAWFWAYHPATIIFARAARPYALLEMLSAASLYLFLVAQKGYLPRQRLFACLALALGLITHYFFLLIFGITLLTALIDMRHRRLFFRRWTLLALAAALPLAAWLVWFFRLENPSFGIGWIQVPKLVDLPITMINLLGGYSAINSLPNLLFGVMVAGLLFIALVAGQTRQFSIRWAVLGLLLPLAGVWIISYQRPVYIDRYFIVLLPVLSMLVSAGATAAWSWIRKNFPGSRQVIVLVPCLLVLAALGMLSGWQIHTDPRYENEDWRGLIAYLNLHQESLPLVWFSDPATSLPFTYYNQSNYQVIQSEELPNCQTPCWWPLRQPYTATHAFTQTVTDPLRPWKPEIPPGCLILDSWESHTNLALWKVQCK